MSLENRIIELTHKYRPLAVELLREVIRLPADYVDRPLSKGGDPLCGQSNHEGPRLAYLKKRIVELGAVAGPKDVRFDSFGNLLWTVQNCADGVAQAAKAVVYLDGHADTGRAMRARWRQELGGIDAYVGLERGARVNKAFLRHEVGYLPPAGQWHELVFGRGAASQLAGVVGQVIATRILLELADKGALNGVIVISAATVTEQDNDGAGPRQLMRDLARSPALRIPDVVLLTEATGHAEDGACGIYRGQRGRMQIEVVVTGKSAHASMPWQGLNPLEHAGRMIAEAAERYERTEGFLDDTFLGVGTRTASWIGLDTPSDRMVPERCRLRFDRRLTIGESPDKALADIENLKAVARAREHGLVVDVRVPRYALPSWRGVVAPNPQVYAGWLTPEDHLAVKIALDTYVRVVTPQVKESGTGGALRKEPRIGRWIFSTDGVGYPVPASSRKLSVPASKRWVTAGGIKHPAIIGLGPGIEHNAHKIGECVDMRELDAAIAFYARFPSLYAENR
jgi:putative selenium metabolism hydrolase